MVRNNPFLSFTPMVFPYRVNHFTLLNVTSQHTSETSLQIFRAESTQVFRTKSTIPSHFPCRVNHPFKFFPCRVNTNFPCRVNHPFKFFRAESTIPSSFSVPSQPSLQIFRAESTIPSSFPCRVNHPFKFSVPSQPSFQVFPYRVNISQIHLFPTYDWLVHVESGLNILSGDSTSKCN